MKIVVAGHGMVGHKFLESLGEANLRDAGASSCSARRAQRLDRLR